MKKTILAAIAALIMFASATFAQGGVGALAGMNANQRSQSAAASVAKKTGTDGMVWFYLERVKEKTDELAKNVPERDRLVTALGKETADGDKNLIMLYIRRVRDAEHTISLTGDMLVADLKKYDEAAGVALEADHRTNAGQMTEAEYREAKKFVMAAREFLKAQYLSVPQMRVWDTALKAAGVDASVYTISQPPTTVSSVKK